ncbi:MAG: GH3 auxin-responsive promoter family protein [Planctomycetaceae bacterium]
MSAHQPGAAFGMAEIPIRNKLRAVLGGAFRRRLDRQRQMFLWQAKSLCRETQHRVLQGLLELNADSQFSRDFGLRPGLCLQDFQSRLDISDYDRVAPYVDRMKVGDHRALLGRRNRLLMYAVTSGTTSDSKLIPITDRFVADYRRGWQHWGVAAHMQRPQLRHLNMAQITSSHRRFHTPDGTPCGNISGLVAEMQRPIVRRLYSIPAHVAHLNDADAKRYAVSWFALADPWVGMFITANPGTLLHLCQFFNDNADRLIRDISDGTIRCQGLSKSEQATLKRLLKRRPARARELHRILNEHGALKPTECWKALHTLGVWSGGSARAYLTQLRHVYGDVPIRDHGLHASEGRMTSPVDDGTPAGILDIQSHFFEFVPVEYGEIASPDVLEAHELQYGRDYFILLTTSSGLYRYNIRDVVRCVGYYGTTPLLEFRHKGAHISSIAGEKIAESQVVDAVERACRHQEVLLQQFTLTPEWGTPPRYTLFVQPRSLNGSPPASLLQDLSREVDRLLRQANCEYEEKRGTRRLGSVETCVVPDHHWDAFMAQRISRAGGSVEQYKHPCLLPDPHFERLFLTMSRPVSRAIGEEV